MEDHGGAELLDPGAKLLVYSLQVLLIISTPPHITIDLGPICRYPIGIAKANVQDILIVLKNRPRPVSVMAVGINDGEPLPPILLTQMDHCRTCTGEIGPAPCRIRSGMVAGGDGKDEGIVQTLLRYTLGSSHTPPHGPEGTFIVPGIPLPTHMSRGVNLEQELFLNRLRDDERHGWQI
jgi:hypothetical protein